MSDLGQGAPLVPIAPVRWATRQQWRASIGGPLPLPISWSIARDRAPVRRPIAGRVWSPRNAAETPELHPWRIIVGQRPPRAGRVSLTAGLAPPPPAVAFPVPVRPARDPQPKRRRIAGSVWLERFASPGVPPAIPFFVPRLLARDPNPFRRRVPGFARIVPFAPPGAIIPPAVWYHVYANTGAGDPINYATPVATTSGLSWTSAPLSYASDWKFGVRAFYYPNGLEEQNLDCAVEIILDATGKDITNRPAPPTGLRAIAVKGGNIKVEWSYPNPATRAKTPTGFHVYDGIGSVSYTTPAATVSYTSSIANVWTATVSGLSDGTTYSFGVRAYNAIAEEPNTATVTCTSDASGPGAVQSLMGVAV